MKTRSMTRSENAELLSDIYHKTQNLSAHSVRTTKCATSSTQPDTNTRYHLRTRRSINDYAEPDFVYTEDKKDTDYTPFVFQRPVVSFEEPETPKSDTDPIRFQIIEPSDEIILSVRKSLRNRRPLSSHYDLYCLYQ